MTWWQYFKAHGQRPESWVSVVNPAYWRRLHQERTATVRSTHERVPCGTCTTTQFVDASGAVVRQDVAIAVGRQARTVDLKG